MVITLAMTMAMVIMVIPMVTLTTIMEILIDITIVTGITIITGDEMKWSPTGKARGPLLHAHVGRHPGHTTAHPSTARGRGLLRPG